MPNFDNVLATTLKNYSPAIADNMTESHPLLVLLKNKGKMRNLDGGTQITETLEYAENGTVKWFSGYETLDTSPSDVFGEADFDWKQLSAHVTYNGLEKIKNGGKAKMHDLIEKLIGNAEKSMQNEMGAAVHYSNTEQNGKAIGGLKHLVRVTPEVGTVGGIDAADNVWWRNQKISVSTETGSAASATTIEAAMDALAVNCVRGKDTTDLIVSDKNYFLFFLAALRQSQRFTTDKSDAISGFATLHHWASKGEVFYDVQAEANTMRFLNLDYIYLRAHSDTNFTMGEKEKAFGQDAWTRPFLWAGNMTTSNRNVQGVLVA